MADTKQGEKNQVNDTVDGTRMSFFEHLSELAQRLRRVLFAFIIAFVAVSSVPNPLHPFGGPGALFGYDFLLVAIVRLAEQYYINNFGLIAVTLTDPITVFMNLALVLSLIVTMPYIFYEIYGFVAPGLYQREKRAVRKYLLPFTVLFAGGSIFGVVVIFPTIMRILLSFFSAFNLQKLIPITDFINLLLLIPVMTGLAFTFPVFIVPLVEFKIINTKQLSSARKWVYIAIALGVSIANPDPTDISSIPILVPIFVLYEATILIAKRIEKNRLKAAAVAPPA